LVERQGDDVSFWSQSKSANGLKAMRLAASNTKMKKNMSLLIAVLLFVSGFGFIVPILSKVLKYNFMTKVDVGFYTVGVILVVSGGLVMFSGIRRKLANRSTGRQDESAKALATRSSSLSLGRRPLAERQDADSAD